MASTVRRRPSTAPEIIVLGRENEGREPEIRIDPGERGKVSFVGFHQGKDEGGEVEEGIDGGNSNPVRQLRIGVPLGDKVRSYTHDNDGRDPVQEVVYERQGADHLARGVRVSVVVCHG